MLKALARPLRNLAAIVFSAALAATPMSAELARVGPTSSDPKVGGFPSWYQDKSGLTLEFCAPLNTSELNGGWCLLLPGDANPPEFFPTNFFDEHFYFAADSALTPATGGKASLVLAVESAFAGGPAKAGDQITFARIRIRLTQVPVTGTYRIIHPYGEDLIDAAAGDRIFFTEDFGVGAGGGPFDALLPGRLGPFLLPSTTPGGTEMPPVSAQNPTPDRDPVHFGGVFTPTPYPGTGKLYIADPARLGPVTGSPQADFIDSTGATRNHNIFRIEGPAGSGLGGPGIDFIETTDFTLMGRVFTDSVPGRVTVDRASYNRDGSDKYDVFATAFPTRPGRVPGQPTPATVLPQLSFFDAACTATIDTDGNPGPPYSAPAGAAEFQMFNSGSNFWGQATAIPNAVCVKDGASRDANGVTVPSFFPANVVDEVTIDSATYNPSTGTLTVSAHSSDTGSNPALTLLAFGNTPDTNLSSNSVSISELPAPPASVRVHSSRGGQAELPVVTRLGSAPKPTGTPIAVNDATTINEDSGATTVDVLANDTIPQGAMPSVNITTAPRLGTASLDGNNKVVYTPNPDAFGTDVISYTITNGTAVSNTASLTVTITPVNDPPVAAPDTFSAVAGSASTLNLLSNDTDPDGAADIVGIANLSASTPAGATITPGAGGNVTFTAPAGAYTFTYQARDTKGDLSAPATVTVNVAAAEQITIATAEFRTGSLRLRVNGTISPISGQTVTIKWANGTDTSTVVATAVSDATGAWAIDLRNVSGIQDPRRSNATAVVVTGPGGGRQVLNVTIRN